MSESEEKGDSIEHHISEVSKDPNYKVLTKEEYEVLLNASVKKEHKTSTPIGALLNAGLNNKASSPLKKACTTFSFSPITKLVKPAEEPETPSTGNVSMLSGNQYTVPKLPTFSGTDEPQKGEVKCEVWNFEVKCLQNSGQYQEHILLHAVRKSLKGLARSMLVSVGDKDSLEDIMKKVDNFFGNVASGETLMQSFYNDRQKKGDSIVVYASRLEDTLSKAITLGHIETVARDGILRSKFWTGLFSQQLKQSSRHLFDSIKNFEYLFRESRKIQEEITAHRSIGYTKSSKQAFIHAERAEASPTSTDLQKELQTITRTTERLEQKIDNNSKSF